MHARQFSDVWLPGCHLTNRNNTHLCHTKWWFISQLANSSFTAQIGAKEILTNHCISRWPTKDPLPASPLSFWGRVLLQELCSPNLQSDALPSLEEETAWSPHWPSANKNKSSLSWPYLPSFLIISLELEALMFIGLVISERCLAPNLSHSLKYEVTDVCVLSWR